MWTVLVHFPQANHPVCPKLPNWHLSHPETTTKILIPIIQKLIHESMRKGYQRSVFLKNYNLNIELLPYLLLLKNLTFTSIWHFCKAVFRISTNESENCGEELICPRSSFSIVHFPHANHPVRPKLPNWHLGQLTLGPSRNNYKNFDSDNPEIDSRIHEKRLSAFSLSKKLQSKYRVTTIFVVLLKNLKFASIWHFYKAVFRISTNESENCGKELICLRNSTFQYGAIPYKIMLTPLSFSTTKSKTKLMRNITALNIILKILLILLHEL